MILQANTLAIARQPGLLAASGTPTASSDTSLVADASSWADTYATITGVGITATVLTIGTYYTYRWLKSKQEGSNNTQPPVLLLALIYSAAIHAIGLRHQEIGHFTQRAIETVQTWFESAEERTAGSEEVSPSQESSNPPLIIGDQQLIREAQDALIHWQQTGELGDLDGFTLRMSTQLRQPKPTDAWAAEFIQGWNDYRHGLDQEHLSNVGPIQNITQASLELDAFRSHISNDFPYYLEPQPDMTRLYETKIGNCEARAMTMATAFNELTSNLPEHLVLGMEMFGNKKMRRNRRNRHIQPVLYDRQARESWDLWTGEMRTENKGDLYHAAIIYHAYLKGQGAESPVTKAELLLARAQNPDQAPEGAPEEGAGERGQQWRSPFSFPDSDAYYGASIADSEPEPETAGSTLDAQRRQDIQRIRERLQNELGQMSLYNYSDSSDWELVLQTQAQQEYYEALKDDAAKRAYLESVFQDSLRRFIAGEDFALLQRLFADPYTRLPKATADELDRARSTLKSYIWLTGKNLDVIRYLHGTAEEAYDNGISLYKATVRKFPKLKRFDRNFQAYLRSIVAEPQHFILMLDQVSGYEQKEHLAWLLYYHYRSDLDAYDTIKDVLKDPSRLGLLDTPVDRHRYVPPNIDEWLPPPDYESMDLIDFEFMDTGEPDLQTGTEPTLPNDGEAAEQPSDAETDDTRSPALDVPAQIFVSPETLIDSFLSFGEPFEQGVVPFKQRWNATLSQHYIALTPDEERDFIFSGLAKRLLKKAIPKEKREQIFQRLYDYNDQLEYGDMDDDEIDNASHAEQWRLYRPYLRLLPPPVRATLQDIRRRRGDAFVMSSSGYIRMPRTGPKGIEEQIKARHPRPTPPAK